MRVVGLALAGVLATATPMSGHAAGRVRTCGQPIGDRPQISCWYGKAAVPAGTRGRLAATRRRAECSNGTGDLIGGQTAVLSAGVHMPGKVSQLTGSGFLGVQSSIIPSRTGEAQLAGGVIRSRHRSRSRTCDPEKRASSVVAVVKTRRVVWRRCIIHRGRR
jgi:hypothetical protein